MECSIIIRAYNEEKHLGRLLEGIQHQTTRDVEVILVDSGSTDSTVAIANSFGARVVHIDPAEFTFGRSLNRGIQQAAGEYALFASAHVYPVYPDWLECLLKPFSDPRVALVYGKQRGTVNSKFSETRLFKQWYPEADVLRQQSPFCNNANAAIRRRLWQEHPYDESLTGLEDLGWSVWARQHDWEIAYSAHAEIIHVHNETPSAVYNRYRREGMGFKQIFPESHFNIYDFVRLTLANIFSDLLAASSQAVLLRNIGSIFWFRTAQFWGTYQGYRRSSAVTQILRETFYYPRDHHKQTSGDREIEPIRYNHKP
jgi:glycosyltransferase involved in cell wall biosynthesis